MLRGPSLATRQLMAALLYRCPTTGLQVQGWLDDDEPDDGKEVYEG
jgi:hypothetical protein